MLQYHFACPDPLAHYLNVTLTIPAAKARQIALRMPAWRPGRYEMAHFARNVRTLQAFGTNNRLLPCRKVDRDGWEVEARAGETVTVRYEYFAHTMDAGNSFVDERQWQINFISCALYLPDRMGEACRVTLDLPEGYRAACGLDSPAPGTWLAPNYHRLASSPLLASPRLGHLSYEVDETTFHIWTEGDHTPDAQRWLTDFQLFTEQQLQMMGDFPARSYHFLFQLLPYRFRHGVEFFNSTLITIGPDYALGTDAAYEDLLGIASHELFHTWNVVRLRPAELLPYDFGGPAYFPTGYVAEGVTTYYGDLFLARAGVFDEARYAEELTALLRRHFGNPARLRQSVADASHDLWLDGYRPGVPGRKVSIYTEGAVAALILDLLLRRESDHARSLDDVFRRLWTAHEKTGYTAADYRQAAEAVAGRSLKDYFARTVEGATDLTDWLTELLAEVGFALTFEPAPTPQERYFGFRTDAAGVVMARAEGSPAAAALSVGDRVVAVDGQATAHDLSERLNHRPVALGVFRKHRWLIVALEPTENTFFDQPRVSLAEGGEAARWRWLRGALAEAPNPTNDNA